MKITKIGHCCLVVEVAGKKIMTDPGGWTVGQNEVTDVDFVLITHEHGDHLHIGSLKRVLENNPDCKVVTNASVGKILSQEGINFVELNGIDGVESCDCGGVLVEAYDGRHEEIYGEVGQVQNTGFFIANKLFYPGDSFIKPNCEVEILAAPVAAPWCTLKQAINYILDIKPKIAFPVHDNFIDIHKVPAFHNLPKVICEQNGISFISLKDGGELEF